MTDYDIVQTLLEAYDDMRTGSRNDLKDAADEITALREKIRLYERSSMIDSFAAGYKIEKATLEQDKYKQAIASIVNTVNSESSHPERRQAVVTKHRREWPALWNQIDKALDMFKDSNG